MNGDEVDPSDGQGDIDELLDELLRPDSDDGPPSNSTSTGLPVEPRARGPVTSKIALTVIASVALGSVLGGAYWVGAQRSDGSGSRITSAGPATDPVVPTPGVGTAEAVGQGSAADAGPRATLTARLDRGAFEVRGRLPGSDVVDRIIATSAVLYGPGRVTAVIFDRTLPTPSWEPRADDLIAALPIISNGSIELDGETATIRGVASSATKRQRFRDAVERALGGSVRIVDEIEIDERGTPRLVMRKSEEEAVHLSGVLPSAEVGDHIVEVISGAYPGHLVDTDFTVDDTVEETFALHGLPAFAALFAEFQAWEISYVDETLTSSASDATPFAVDSAALPASMMRILDRFAIDMRGVPDLTLVVEGHTDASGDPANDRDLSERRALAVVEYLTLTHGIDESRLSPRGLGSDLPLADNATSDGGAGNRGLVFIIDIPGD